MINHNIHGNDNVYDTYKPKYVIIFMKLIFRNHHLFPTVELLHVYEVVLSGYKGHKASFQTMPLLDIRGNKFSLQRIQS